MKKRIISLLLTCAMILPMVLSGCGNDSNKDNPSSSAAGKESSKESSVASSEEKEVELEPVELVHWLMGDKTEDADKVEDAVNEYLKDVLPNTTVDFVWISTSEYADRWQKALAAEEKIDLAWHGWVQKLGEDIEMGALLPMDDLIAEYGQEMAAILGERVMETFKGASNDEGKTYFLPAWQGLISGLAMIFPKENVDLLPEGWLEDFQAAYDARNNENVPLGEAGASLYDYYEEYLEASKQAGKLGLGYNMSDTIVDYFGIYYWNMYEVFGDTVYVDNPTKVGSSYYNNVKKLHEWYHKGYIREDILTAESKVTTFSPDTKDNNYISKKDTSSTWTFDVTASSRAGYPMEVVYMQDKYYMKQDTATGMVIPFTAEDPERSMMYMNLIYSDAELYRLIVHGIEGTHYTKNADGTITIPENVQYVGPANWTMGTCLNSYTTDPTQLTYYQDIYEAEKTAELEIPTIGPKVNDPDLEAINANKKALGEEYGTKRFITSDNFDELFTEWADKVNALGWDKWLEAYYDKIKEEYADPNGWKISWYPLSEN